MNEPQVNRTKVRLGLAIVSVVVVVAVGVMTVVDDPLGKLVMLLVAVVGAFRLFLLRRSMLSES